ncbi:YHYH domain-containing protein [Acinetobacter kanungonis]|nr:YHYH domain-containing protein [Acinetobacter kanungonis]NCI80091.1 YHYH domain-containing protein [Acinetobacter kanungonis]
MTKILAIILVATFATAAYSHSGGTDKNGCHKPDTVNSVEFDLP